MNLFNKMCFSFLLLPLGTSNVSCFFGDQGFYTQGNLGCDDPSPKISASPRDSYSAFNHCAAAENWIKSRKPTSTPSALLASYSFVQMLTAACDDISDQFFSTYTVSSMRADIGAVFSPNAPFPGIAWHSFLFVFYCAFPIRSQSLFHSFTILFIHMATYTSLPSVWVSWSQGSSW